MNRRTDIDSKKSEIEQWVSENRSREEISSLLDCWPGTVSKRLEEWGLEYGGDSGSRPWRKTHVLEKLENGEKLNSSAIREALISDGVKEGACEWCGLIEWNGKSAPLELDHIDGNKHNWELSNLRILCANCHAQTKTYRGKNIGSYSDTQE